MNFEDRNNYARYAFAAEKGLYSEAKLLIPESSLLMDYPDTVDNKKVLELGAGSGRIVPLMLTRAREYLATDVNGKMVDSIIKRYPRASALDADARNLQNFQDKDWDSVFFTFNGIDSVAFSERPSVISEVARVLKPGGYFIHSTHNLDHAKRASYSPLSTITLSSPIDFLIRIFQRIRLKRREYFGSEFAVVNDRSLRNGLLNVYVDIDVHLQMLKQHGFSILSMYDRQGRSYSIDQFESDQWYYFVAQKNET